MMKNKIIAAFLCGLLCVPSMTSNAKEFWVEQEEDTRPTPPGYRYSDIYTSGDYKFEVFEDDGTCYVYEYNGMDTVVTVPADFEGHPVVGIGMGAFQMRVLVREVILPDTIKEIRENAFYRCVSLRTINFPKNLERLHDLALTNAYELNGLKLNRNLKYIEDYAFQLCDSINIMNIPGSVESISKNTFQNMSDLYMLRFMEGTKEIWEDVALNNAKMRFIVIPPSVKSIGSHAFGYNYFYPDYTKREGIYIFGAIGSEAEKYAKENGFEFIEYDFSYGDVDGDGLVTASDATAVLMEYNRTSVREKGQFSYVQEISGNLNDDTDIDAADASLILMYYAYRSSGGTDTPSDFFFFAE